MIPSVLPHDGRNDGTVSGGTDAAVRDGINTLLQSLFGRGLPTGDWRLLRLSLIPIMAIIQDSSLSGITDGHERFLQTMRAIQGGTDLVI
ncbi:hypothetical protein PR202_ga09588 [Eleusine coracana subsp. coracana]|uniref:Uncharacterized protein n=1 Tax=Eleusine coracana subsp. coracana TaxID=191504 RepID=A0AAV5C4K2_ELECO|nr:hypothetical protein PR202_ga09588 [Eleusine coracana subsp. coracana]